MKPFEQSKPFSTPISTEWCALQIGDLDHAPLSQTRSKRKSTSRISDRQNESNVLKLEAYVLKYVLRWCCRIDLEHVAVVAGLDVLEEVLGTLSSTS